jgi:hypothetical protein
MEITAYNLHGGSFRPSLGFMRTQVYSALVGSRRCYEITRAAASGGSVLAGNRHPTIVGTSKAIQFPIWAKLVTLVFRPCVFFYRFPLPRFTTNPQATGFVCLLHPASRAFLI